MTGPLGMLHFHLDHHYTQHHVSEFLDRELSEDGRARVSRHAALCPKCARLIASLRATLAALAGLATLSTEPDAAIVERVIERLGREP